VPSGLRGVCGNYVHATESIVVNCAHPTRMQEYKGAKSGRAKSDSRINETSAVCPSNNAGKETEK